MSVVSTMRDRTRSSAFTVLAAAVLLLSVALLPSAGSALAASIFPGGFLEKATSGEVRPLLTAAQLQALLPVRGPFTFPAPYNTEAIRITNAGDCSGGGDCVLPVGYSYWANINNHTGSDTMLMFVTLSKARGGGGPTLFSYDKVTGQVAKVGPLFDAASRYSSFTGEGWYFSGTQPHALYIMDGAKLLRYDVVTRQFTTVYDASASLGGGIYVWQGHSSADDRVHIATVRSSTTYDMLGCLAYREDTRQLSFYAERGVMDECHLDKSGRWLVMLDNVDLQYSMDNRIIDLQTGAETVLLDQNGAAGHADMGYGYMVAEDNWAPVPSAVKLWKLGQSPLEGQMVYSMTDWAADVGHITHQNAAPSAAPEQQFVCSSNASRAVAPRVNEVVCYRLDSSFDVLVVAPVMTDLNAAGGGDEYSKDPKGNLDVTGRYFIWTSNAASGRLDAFMVKVPAHKLAGTGLDVTPPVVAISAPLAGATVTGSVTVSALATDDVGVAGVQFRLDGNPLGAELTAPPWTRAWDTTAAANGSHTLTAVARDAAGHTTTSPGVAVTVSNTVAPPVISAVTVSGISTSGATIAWSTNTPSNTQVEYGTTASYGGLTPLQTAMTTSHVAPLGGLSPATLYHFRVRSRDAAGGLSVSGDYTLSTTSGTAVDVTPPVVAISAPLAGATVTGTVTVSALATDDVGVAGVQFRLDGNPLGAELTAPPWAIGWNTTTAANGSHVLSAVARDAAARKTTSLGVAVTVGNTVAPPVISAVAVSGISTSGATIAWSTNTPSDTQVEYGKTTSYGSLTPLQTALTTSHAAPLGGLSPATLYHFRVRSRDAAGQLSASSDYAFSTTSGTVVDVTPPVVAIGAPSAGSTVTGSVTVSALATDDVGVVGVQFRLDGSSLGAELTAPPWAVTWNTTTAANGSHVLSAVARDAAGRRTTSAGVGVTVNNLPPPPAISAVEVFGISASGATITWTTSTVSDTQVEYGTTTAYGKLTPLNTIHTASHTASLAGLASGTLYHFRVLSRDTAGRLSTSGDYTFSTSAANDLGFWRFEDSGLVARDLTINRHDGTLVNGPTWTPGRIGQGLRFDGLDDYVRVPHRSTLNSYPLTVSVWMKTPQGGQGAIVNKYAPGSRNGYQVFLNGGSLCAWYFRDASNYIWDGSGCTLAVPAPADGAWHFVVFVVEADGGRLYLDGALRASRAWTGAPGAPSTQQDLSFARYESSAIPHLETTLDHIRIYGRALGESEVRDNYLWALGRGPGN